MTGPATPPIGTGSLNLFTGNGVTGGDGAVELRNIAYVDTPLSDLTALSYDTYATSWNGQQLPYLGLELDLDGDTQFDDIIFFEPAYQTPGTGNPLLPDQGSEALNTWQHWDALVGGWWSNNGIANATPGTGVKSLSDYLAAEPNAKIVNRSNGLGGVRFTVGFASDIDVFNANVDNITIGTTTTTTFDFENIPPTNVYVDPTWAGTNLGLDPDGAGPATVFGSDAFISIQAGINAVASGGTVNVATGTYTENASSAGKDIALSPGSNNPAQVTINGDLTLDNTDTLTVQIDGNIAGTSHDQLNVTGTVELGGVNLVTSGTVTSNPGQQIVLISNDATDAVVGTFNGFAEGDTVTIGAVDFLLSYAGGPHANDVTLTEAGPVTYMSDGIGPGALELRLVGGNVVFVDDGVIVDSRPLGSLVDQLITIDGSDPANETLLLNFAFGGFFDVDVLFNGGIGAGGNDKLVVDGGSFTTAEHTFTTVLPAEHSGNIVYDTGAASVTISYTGLEPVDMTGSTIADLIFNLPVGSANDFRLEDDGNLTNGLNRIVSNGGTFETTLFVNPTGSLTINSGGLGDYFNLYQLDDGYYTLGAPITFNGGAGADRMYVHTNASTTTIPAGGVSFVGSGNNDGFSILPGYVATTIAHSFTNSNDGSVNIDGSTIDYDDMNVAVGIYDQLTATNRTFQFTAGNDTISFGDDPTANDSFSRISSSGSVTTDFKNPSETFVLNGGDGDDTITIGSFAGMDAQFIAAVTIDGEGDTDSITQNAALTLGSGASTGNLSLTAESIDLNATISTTAGTVGDVTLLGTDISINTAINAGGNVSATATNNIDLAGGSITTSSNADVLAGNMLTTDAAGTDITATNASLSGAGGIGTLANPIRLSVDTLVTNSNDLSDGDQFLVEADTLNIGAADLDAGTATITLVSGTFLTTATGSILSPTVVGNGATLGGNGTVTGSVTVQSGGAVSPGPTTAILNIGSQTFTAGSNFDVEVDGNVAGTSYDQLNVTGTVDLGGATLNATGSIPSQTGQVIVLINNDEVDPITGTFAGLAEGDTVFINGIGFKLSYQGGTGNDVTLTQLIQVTLTATPGSMNEDDPGLFTFTFTRDGILDVMTVNYSIASAATFITDYLQTGAKSFNGLTGTVVFGFGQTTAIVTIDPEQDLLVEPDESLTITLLPGDIYVPGVPHTATVTILDDDNDVSVSASPASVTEDGGMSIDYTFTRTGTHLDPLTVSFAVNGTATFGTDYTQSGAATFSSSVGTVMFPAGIDTVVVSVTPTADGDVESDETVRLTLTTGTGYQFVAPNTATGTITNDDILVLPEVTVAVAPGSVTEDGPDKLVFTFTRDLASDVMTLNFNVGGTASFAGLDYTQTGAATFDGSTGTVVFGYGQTTATVVIDPTIDSAIELDEDVSLTIAAGAGYTIGAPNSASGTITNDDGILPDINVSVSPASVMENGSANLIYTFTRSSTVTNPLTVAFTVDGTATLSSDYTQSGAKTFSGSSGTVTFGFGQSTATVIVNPKSDGTIEPDETVVLTLTPAATYNIGVMDTATGTITNDDVGVSVAVSPATVTEDGMDTLVYTFTRTGPTTNALTAKFSVNGTATFSTDYTQTGAATFSGSSGTVTFSPGSDTAIVTIDPTADGTVELDETVKLTVTSGSGYKILDPKSATGTITNDDVVVDADVSVTVSPASVMENGSTNLVYTFTRSNTSASVLTVNFTVGGDTTLSSDYSQSGAKTFSGSSGSVTFGFGQTTALVTINPKSDSTVEADETVTLTVVAGSGYNVGAPTAATGTILNDDIGVSVAVAPASVTEDGVDDLVYTFTRTGPLTNSLVVNFAVNGTAKFGTDYAQSGATTFGSGSGKVTFAPGSDTAIVAINPTPDTAIEANETVKLSLSNSSSYKILSPSSAIGTILDDDTITVPQVSIAVSPSGVVENRASNLVYTFTRTGTESEPLTVNFTVGGTATFVDDYTQSGAATFTGSTGSVTFGFGQITAIVVIDPHSDLIAEPTETVVLTVTAGAGYSVGAPDTASGNINNALPSNLAAQRVASVFGSELDDLLNAMP